MEKATPVQIRKSLEVVEILKRAGIHFVPIPVLNKGDFKELTTQLLNRLGEISNKSELME